MKVRDALKILKEDGWYFVRQTGSHRIFAHPVKLGTVTVAGHPSVELPPKTLRSIRRQAGLDEN